MSYILEALKKSDQQRQRGATPTLQVAQVTVAAPKRPMFIYYSLLAAVLLIAGILIGWLQPGQPAQAPFEGQPATAVAPVAVPFAMPTSPVQEPPARISDKPDRLAGDGQAQETIPLNELPIALQQEIPAMTVQLHAYSSVPGERLVSINSIRLREGGSLMFGLRLEQITPDGMIFSYKGYRFRHGIR